MKVLQPEVMKIEGIVLDAINASKIRGAGITYSGFVDCRYNVPGSVANPSVVSGLLKFRLWKVSYDRNRWDLIVKNVCTDIWSVGILEEITPPLYPITLPAVVIKDIVLEMVELFNGIIVLNY